MEQWSGANSWVIPLDAWRPSKKEIAITEGGTGQDIELGKKLEQSRYIGYFWVAQDKKGDPCPWIFWSLWHT